MTKPTVSIAMPVYNAEAYLKYSIESILNQTYQDIEFLIVNDGSIDNSLSLIKSYNDSRIKLLSHSVNKGLSYSLNEAVRLASGKYIARMDADDISVANRIFLQVEYMEKNQDVGICATNVKSIDNSGAIISKTWWKQSGKNVGIDLLWGNPIAHPTVLMRKSLIDSIKTSLYKDISYVEDYELWTRVARYTKLWRMGEVLLYHREHSSNIFAVGSNEGIQSALKINKTYIEKEYGLKVPSYHKNLTKFIGYGKVAKVGSLRNYYSWLTTIMEKSGGRYIHSFTILYEYFMKLTREQKLAFFRNI